MMCSNPFLRGPNFSKLDVVKGGVDNAIPFPCGKCLHCRINQARIWTHRILLELACHKDSVFVTLTYNDENLPKGEWLDRTHAQNYIKRLRKYFPAGKIRVFGCGEYGDINYRPHFHMCIFGLGPQNDYEIKRCWTKNGKEIGFVHIGEVNKNSARYITGYILKKNTSRKDLLLAYRPPEYSFQSRKPGIGGINIDKVKKDLQENEWYVPRSHSQFKYGKDMHLPLGRYMFERLNFDLVSDEQLDKESSARKWDEVNKRFDYIEENGGMYYDAVLAEKAQAKLRQRKLRKMREKKRRL